MLHPHTIEMLILKVWSYALELRMSTHYFTLHFYFRHNLMQSEYTLQWIIWYTQIVL